MEKVKNTEISMQLDLMKAMKNYECLQKIENYDKHIKNEKK